MLTTIIILCILFGFGFFYFQAHKAQLRADVTALETRLETLEKKIATKL